MCAHLLLQSPNPVLLRLERLLGLCQLILEKFYLHLQFTGLLRARRQLLSQEVEPLLLLLYLSSKGGSKRREAKREVGHVRTVGLELLSNYCDPTHHHTYTTNTHTHTHTYPHPQTNTPTDTPTHTHTHNTHISLYYLSLEQEAVHMYVHTYTGQNHAMYLVLLRRIHHKTLPSVWVSEDVHVMVVLGCWRVPGTQPSLVRCVRIIRRLCSLQVGLSKGLSATYEGLHQGSLNYALGLGSRTANPTLRQKRESTSAATVQAHLCLVVSASIACTDCRHFLALIRVSCLRASCTSCSTCFQCILTGLLTSACTATALTDTARRFTAGRLPSSLVEGSRFRPKTAHMIGRMREQHHSWYVLLHRHTTSTVHHYTHTYIHTYVHTQHFCL